MIGLKRGIVEIVDHDPDWAGLALASCQAVRNACRELLADVQHVGSTAMPGLPAKPILDIAAAVLTFDAMPEIVPRLARIGYLYRGDHRDDGGHLFVAGPSPDIRTIHLHVVEHGGSQWRNYLGFRDLLCRQPAIREEYAELKKRLASLYADDRESYAASKAGFIRDILDNHLDWRTDSDRKGRQE
jgi:GrpB-like predicted nucleotidyltransferase (UPF0157 family)